MRELTSIEEVKNILDSARKKKLVSNCFFMKEQLESILKKERLWLMKEGDNTFLLEETQGFYRVYYFLQDFDNISRMELKLPAVIEFVFRNEPDEGQKKEIAAFEAMGFSLGRESMRITIRFSDYKGLTSCPAISGMYLGFAEEEDCDGVLELLYASFNKLYAHLPDKDEQIRMIQDKNTLIVKKDGKILGVRNFEIRGNIAVGLQTATSKIGSGIGGLLFFKYIEIIRDRVKAFRYWVDVSNPYDGNLHEKLGGSSDGTRAFEYIKPAS